MEGKKSIGMTNAPEFSIDVDPELEKQVVGKNKSYESVKTPGYIVVVSDINDSSVAYYQKGSVDKVVQQAPINLFKQLYKEVA